MKEVFAKNHFFLYASLLGILYSSCVSADTSKPAGEKIFIANSCNVCHSIESQSIKKDLASSKAPDLSNVGSERTADWLTKWLTRKEELHGKKHLKKWTGKPEDLKTLVDWLTTLKTEKKDK